MCGIAGFCGYSESFLDEKEKWERVLTGMRETLKRRGPDDRGNFIEKNCGLTHTRLSIIDPETGRQPMVKNMDGRSFAISYNGELYNMPELKNELKAQGFLFETKSDAEVILNGFISLGAEFVNRINGIFAFAVWDSECLYLFRDRVGVKPLFYTIQDNTLIFGSEIKALFSYPGVEAVIDKNGLCDIFALGPARRAESGVFKNIYSLPPGYYAVFGREGFKSFKYWDVTSKPHEDSYEVTLEKTGFLIRDSIKRQMISDVPICSFLSGGVDSSVVTAITANELKKQGKVMNTYSFDFAGNDKFFQSNAFQPARDRPWVDKMVEFLGTNHIYLECETQKMADLLYDAVDAKDLPGMADVDSSLLYFCGQVSKTYKVAMTGECADEIFGGYPWFHSKEAFETAAFPWSRDMEARKALLSDDLLETLDLQACSRQAYAESVGATPRLAGESAEESRRREISYLNLKWFMTTLLDRMDRAGMNAGLEARVPFADHRVIEYVWNVPWDMKYRDEVVKSLLRESVRGVIPDEILFRKKSPYPKSYNPSYEKLLGERLLEVINDPSSPVTALLDKKKVNAFISSPKDYGRPWFGQLMAGPQMLAYILQVDYWLRKYSIKLI